MRFVNAEEIRSLLTFPILVDASGSCASSAEGGSTGWPSRQRDGTVLRPPRGRSRPLHGEQTDHQFSRESRRPRPAGGAGRPRAVRWNERPTARGDGRDGDHVLAYRCGFGPRGQDPRSSVDPATLLMVGAGEMSMRLVHAHRAVRPSLRRALIWNRTRERAVEVAARLTAGGNRVRSRRRSCRGNPRGGHHQYLHPIS